MRFGRRTSEGASAGRAGGLRRKLANAQVRAAKYAVRAGDKPTTSRFPGKGITAGTRLHGAQARQQFCLAHCAVHAIQNRYIDKRLKSLRNAAHDGARQDDHFGLATLNHIASGCDCQRIRGALIYGRVRRGAFLGTPSRDA